MRIAQSLAIGPLLKSVPLCSLRRPLVRVLLCQAAILVGITATGKCEEPVKVDVCQLQKDPKLYHQKLVEVTGFISHGFEDFTFFGPGCVSGLGIWLEYGGKVNSGTIYCCGVTADRSRPGQLHVGKIAVPLIADKRFREFDLLIQQWPSSLVHATLVGRFFAKPGAPGEILSGYGHMGCCSLLAIQQVLTVDSRTRYGLDYQRYTYRPDANCEVEGLLESDLKDDLIRAQRTAELSGREWAFHDPQRVAAEAVARLTNTDPKSIRKTKWVDGEEGRVVYRWTDKQKKLHYFVELSHPYLLVFEAVDPKKIAWVPIAAYQSTCKMDFPGFHKDFGRPDPAFGPTSLAIVAAPMH